MQILSHLVYKTYYFTIPSIRVTIPSPIATNEYQICLYIKYMTYEILLFSQTRIYIACFNFIYFYYKQEAISPSLE